VTLSALAGSLSQRTDALVLPLERHALDVGGSSPAGAYRAAGTLGIMDGSGDGLDRCDPYLVFEFGLRLLW